MQCENPDCLDIKKTVENVKAVLKQNLAAIGGMQATARALGNCKLEGLLASLWLYVGKLDRVACGNEEYGQAQRQLEALCKPLVDVAQEASAR